MQFARENPVVSGVLAGAGATALILILLFFGTLVRLVSIAYRVATALVVVSWFLERESFISSLVDAAYTWVLDQRGAARERSAQRVERAAAIAAAQQRPHDA